MSAKRRKKPPATVEQLPQIPPPCWIPPGVDFNIFPREVQTAIVEIVNPVYEQLVIKTSDSLEQSTGLTIVYLLWMEILNQHQLGQEYHPDSFLRTLGDYRETFARQLQLVEAKAKTGYVLVRLRELRNQYIPLPNPVSLPAPNNAAPSSPLPLGRGIGGEGV